MIRTLIIEDEAPAAHRLRKLLQEAETTIRVLETLDSVSSAIKWFGENDPPDLLMLDIQLADGLSFEIFEKVSIDSFVIFTTAFDEYAIKAFELNSVDYLLKPVDPEKLHHALKKLLKLQGHPRPIDINALVSAMTREKEKYKERFVIQVGSSIMTIKSLDIAYFYSLEKNIFLVSNEGRNYPLDISLDRLEGILDPNHFFRINRQHLVNFRSIKKIKVLSKSRISILTSPASEEPLLVSTARTHLFRLWLDR